MRRGCDLHRSSRALVARFAHPTAVAAEVGRVYRGAPVVLEAGNKPEGLKGLRVLVAEDEFAIAMFLVDYLELKGAQVVGPAGDLQALGRLVDDNPIDVALLDINLGGEQVYPLADRLAEAGTPFMLTSGYDDNLPSRFADAPRCTKPYHIEALVQQLAGLVATPQAPAGIA